MVEALLKKNHLQPSQLSAVALGHGPGSYTGLRIGASFSKALCYSLGIPLISVSSLRALAFGLSSMLADHDLIVSMIDARRMDAYVGIYSTLLETEEEGFYTLDEALWSRFSDKKILLAGTGALKFKEHYSKLNADHKEVELKAELLFEDALRKYRTGKFEDVAYYEPNYVKAVHITAKKRTHFN